MSVGAVLSKRDRELQAARDAVVANCLHDDQPRGFLLQCTKCKRFRDSASPSESSKG